MSSRLAFVFCLAAALGVGCSGGSSSKTTSGKKGRRVLVLGLDGMDHGIVTKMLSEGKLPNLAKLGKIGGFKPLTTSVPPQSPSAWSNFITGKRPGHHGIFDFVQRDPKTLAPYLSTSKVEAGTNLALGCLNIPLRGGKAKLLRKETPFWTYLTRAGVPATVIKMPSHFPPEDDGDARVLTDMGTPDLLGTYGTFTWLTSSAEEAKKQYSGGRTVRLIPRKTGALTGSIEGPADPMDACGAYLEQTASVRVDREAKGALISFGDNETVLGVGQWSEFVPITFETAGGLSGVTGVVRVYLKAIDPVVRIYVSPINIDPLDPALPISSPPEFAAELTRKGGRYYTQGMPEDTKVLAAGLLTTEEFLAQAKLVLERRRAMFHEALASFDRGFLFFYFGSSDQITHMLYRAMDSEHPARTAADNPYKSVIEDTYSELDKEVGLAMKALGKDDLLLVISDHGFGPASYLFDLNGWLQEQGYLVLRKEPIQESLGHIDWEQTQAYGLGLNGLYFNIKGREKHGVVPKERVDQLAEKLASELQAVYHPLTGRQAISEVERPATLYPGPEVHRAPDLIVGYGRGFKVHDSSAMGGVAGEMYAINRGEWSGDHCGDHRLVPGILFSNAALNEGPHSLFDLPPTVFSWFDVPAVKGWVGKSALAKKGKKATESN